MTVDAALRARARAAIELVSAGEISPASALFLTVWPSVEVQDVSTRHAGRDRYTDDQRRRAVALVQAGASWAAAGREVGAPKQTVALWVRGARWRDLSQTAI